MHESRYMYVTFLLQKLSLHHQYHGHGIRIAHTLVRMIIILLFPFLWIGGICNTLRNTYIIA